MFTTSDHAFQHPYQPRAMAAMDPAGTWRREHLAPNCPRCASKNTKFCYYNNYSLAQPRYFCKGCRRYWTKGGSLRNVPVGGGCRKSRRSRSSSKTPQYHGGGGGGGGGDGSNSNDDPFGPNRPPADSSSGRVDIDLAAVFARYLNQDKAGPQCPPKSPPSSSLPCLGEKDRSDLSKNRYIELGSQLNGLPKELEQHSVRQTMNYVADTADGKDRGSVGGSDVEFWDNAEMILGDALWSSPKEDASALSTDFTSWQVEDLDLPPLIPVSVVGDDDNGRLERGKSEDVLMGDINWSCFDLAGYEICSRP